VAPYGYLTYHPRPDKRAVLLSTGTGIAPFRSSGAFWGIFEKNPPQSTLFCLGVRTDHDILYGNRAFFHTRF
jgi:ferredoxin-NADP reductase